MVTYKHHISLGGISIHLRYLTPSASYETVIITVIHNLNLTTYAHSLGHADRNISKNAHLLPLNQFLWQ